MVKQIPAEVLGFQNPRFQNPWSLTSITTRRGGGNSTLGLLLCTLAEQPYRMARRDCSDILKLAAKQQTDLGRAVKVEIESIPASGKLMSDGTVCRAVEWWLGAIKREAPTVNHTIIPGFARSVAQLEVLKKNNGRLIHIYCTETESLEGVRLRDWVKGQAREDSGDDALLKNWAEYEENILPAARAFGKGTLFLDYAMPVIEQLKKAIDHIVLDEPVKQKMRHRLESPNHPIHKEIKNLHEKREEFRHKFPQFSSVKGAQCGTHFAPAPGMQLSGH